MKSERIEVKGYRNILIVVLLLSVSAYIHAAEVVATITAYNKAELSGETTSTMAVSFTNTNHSKGTLTAGSEATMSIVNFPKGAITKVVLYVKSNSNSGAGSVAISIDNTPVAKIKDSSFSEWQSAGYSTSPVPISFEGYWRTHTGSELVCRMTASVNSLGWEKAVITYVEAAPEPQTVSLSWLDADGKRQITDIKENEAGNGVILPQSEVMELAEGWKFEGWAKEKITSMYTSSPSHWSAGQYFYPETQTTLYAVYKQSPTLVVVPQATKFVSGEYAIAAKGPYYYCLMTGDVTNNYVGSGTVNIKADGEGLYHLTDGYVSPYCRYQIDFEGDSVTIRSSLTGSYIGHNATKLTDKQAKWAWAECKNHSLELSFGREEKDGRASGHVLWLNSDGLFETITFFLGQDYEYMLLFDVTNVPTSAGNVKWTSCPFGEEAIETVVKAAPARKVLRNGVLYIEYNGTEYDVLGHKTD